MKILSRNFNGDDNRVYQKKYGSAVRYTQSQLTKANDHFVVVHTPDKPMEAYIKKMLNRKYCKGILFVKGTSYGGLGNKEAASKLQNDYDDKVHFLSYAVEQTSDLSLDYEERFNEFFRKIKDENTIDWDLIDPTYPESIVAALLLLHACRHSDSLQSVCQKKKGNAIIERAIEEYNSLSGNSEKWNNQRSWSWKKKRQINSLIDKLNKFLSDQQV